MKTAFKPSTIYIKGLDMAFNFAGSVHSNSLNCINSVPNHGLIETKSVALLFLQSRVFPPETTVFIVSQIEFFFTSFSHKQLSITH